MTKTQIISARILALVAEGIEARTAFNTVLGEGAYEKLASDLYDSLRKEA